MAYLEISIIVLIQALSNAYDASVIKRSLKLKVQLFYRVLKHLKELASSE